MRKDRTTYRAKREGYRARSVYKLFQLNSRFKLIKQGDSVLDLGCFPGSWSQAVVQMGANPTGIDKKPIRKVEGMKFIKGDINDKRIFKKLTKYDAIISDLSPNLSGIKEMDEARSLTLVFRALEIAKHHLKKNGNFLCKLFQGEDVPHFVDMLKNNFKTVKLSKPQTSRKHSKEIYIIAKGFRI